MSIITVYTGSDKKEVSFSPGANLLEVLRSNGCSVSAPCGGNGKCGKCRVELELGGKKETVTACRTVIREDCTVVIPDRASDLSWNETAEESQTGPAGRQSGYGAAVDLGTTTLAVRLFDLSIGQSTATKSSWNVQKSYGADVISRIGFCKSEPSGLETLSRLIRGQICEMLEEICREQNIVFSEIHEIFLAGNTVMQHIFAGISPESIASAPFIPATTFDDGALFDLNGIPVVLSPCVAGYVGGDITAGILASGITERKEKALFIDVGTNGEMALGNADGLVTCAVASGPAFEGAGICCGMPAAFGAVNKVRLTDEGLEYEVIGGGEAEGICGSGILDLIACLFDLGYIDAGGKLEEDENGEAVFRLTEQVYITQQDVRQLQLAKAAVAAGIKMLLEASHTSLDEIDHLYLAGGFGNRLDPESAVKIGMLPQALLSRIVPLGNTSLAGASKALLDPLSREKLGAIRRSCRYIELSSDESFNDHFVNEIIFPEECL